ncbi:hypothetical protein BBJ28_00014318 [Nothophytophthora sp. Chile5]|nr:hypothetical protein BBJ28_00014318 [Nothophytophthora sp. Chile5]
MFERALTRCPNFLTASIRKYEEVRDWYLSRGVELSKIPYLFATFPSAMACNMENTLDPKMEVLKHAGLDVTQIMRVLSRSPSIFNMSADSLEANILAFRKLGIPDDAMAQFIANTPTALTLAPENIEKHLALLRKFYGSEAVMKRLLASPTFLLHNTDQLQMAFDFLVAKGFTPERLAQLGTKLVMRTVDGILQPRAEFLESIDADLLANTSWITDSRTMFIRRYPDYPEYEAHVARSHISRRTGFSPTMTPRPGSASSAPKPRKKRYNFRKGDDVLVLREALRNPKVFSASKKHRGEAWNVISIALKREGVLASAKSLRLRLRRIAEMHRLEMAQGKHKSKTWGLSEKTQLLTEYCSQLDEEEEDDVKPPAPKKVKRTPSLTEVKPEYPAAERTFRLATEQAEGGATPHGTRSTTQRATRFVFTDHHDVLLLKAVLDRQDSTGTSGRKVSSWVGTTAALNRQGVRGDTEMLRSRLRKIADLHRIEEASRPAGIQCNSTEKQQLLTIYWQRLNAEELEDEDDHEAKSPSPVLGKRLRSAARKDDVNTTDSSLKKPRSTLVGLLQRFVTEHKTTRKEELELQRQTLALQEQALGLQNKALEVQEKLLRVMEMAVEKL